jgi:FKBP-type peptidyl-prolyl cis-trans isomerase FkpA
MRMKLQTSMVALVLALTGSACGEDDNPFGIVGQPQNSDFAPELGVDLGRMTLTATGMYIEDVTVGTGTVADSGNQVTVRFTGWLIDGTEFDSGEFDFVLGAGRVIPGFEEGVLGMQVGGKRKLVIPPALGYGSLGQGPIPGGAFLVFDVELTAIA